MPQHTISIYRVRIERFVAVLLFLPLQLLSCPVLSPLPCLCLFMLPIQNTFPCPFSVVILLPPVPLQFRESDMLDTFSAAFLTPFPISFCITLACCSDSFDRPQPARGCVCVRVCPCAPRGERLLNSVRNNTRVLVLRVMNGGGGG